MKCRIVAHARPSAHTSGLMAVVHECETHGMPMPSIGSLDQVCPIGKIEQATEQAIARIMKVAQNPDR